MLFFSSLKVSGRVVFLAIDQRDGNLLFQPSGEFVPGVDGHVICDGRERLEMYEVRVRTTTSRSVEKW